MKIGDILERRAQRNVVKVVDFFSGCGGTSAGLQASGMEIVLGIDNNVDAACSFRANFPRSQFICEDIVKLPTNALELHLQEHRGSPLLFAACAPCQPFSKQRRGRDAVDARASLLWQLVRFVKWYRPELLLVENVPGLQSLSSQIGPFTAFVDVLERMGYNVVFRVIDSQNYGVPQRRKRLLLLASCLGAIQFPEPTHGPGTGNTEYSNVWEWIGALPPIAAGETHPTIPNHRASNLSPLNLERIRATPEGGGREHWPPHLLPNCHRNGYSGHTDVYGRMRKDAPASGLTTRCISFSNGRFGHPEQDRGISIREAACLQTFPQNFVFHGSMNSMARQIGNAVPTLLAQRMGQAFVEHVSDYSGAFRLPLEDLPAREPAGAFADGKV